MMRVILGILIATAFLVTSNAEEFPLVELARGGEKPASLIERTAETASKVRDASSCLLLPMDTRHCLTRLVPPTPSFIYSAGSRCCT